MKERSAAQLISMRTTCQTKKMLEIAAMLSGFNTLTSFILSTAYREAERVIHEAQTKRLSNQDRDLILSLFSNPPQPNEMLKGLLKEAERSFQEE